MTLIELKEKAKKIKEELGLTDKISSMNKGELEKWIAKYEENSGKNEIVPRGTISEEKQSSIKDFVKKAEPSKQKSEAERKNTISVKGILEVFEEEGHGFLRCEANLCQGQNDIYMPSTQIKRFRLQTGDEVEGLAREPRENERHPAIIYVNSINGIHPGDKMKQTPFDKLVPIYPNERLHLESPNNDFATRLIDLIAPIGRGQRGMIVAQPKTGKTTLLKNIAKSIASNHKDVHLIVLLIDERPEEVTDMQRSIDGEVIYSTFDEKPEHHIRVAEIALERAMRLVEAKKNVVILLDSITRLARAYNLVIPTSGKTLSGGLDPSALHKPKKFFGAARNIENGGSLTIIATALVETGSRMDDVIFEEFKGTGNMEVHLDRKLQERRIFPAIEISKSGTRKEELLLDKEELSAMYLIRRAMNNQNPANVTETLINQLSAAKSNKEFVDRINKIYE